MTDSRDSAFREALAQHARSLDILINGSADICAAITSDTAQAIGNLDYDLADDSESGFEEIVDTARMRLEVNLDYRKSYADSIFASAGKTFPLHVQQHEQSVLTNLRKSARALGPDHPSVRVLAGFSYPTESQLAMATTLDAELWLYLQESAAKLGPDHPKIRSLLSTASSARAGAAMSAGLDNTVWQFIQQTADELGPEHSKLRSILAAASATQSADAMSAALNKKVWIAARDVARELGLSHYRLRQVLSAASTPEVADVMLGLLYRQGGSDSMPRIAHEFFAARERRYVQEVTQSAAANNPHSEWLMREDPESVAAVIQMVKKIRRDGASLGNQVSDSVVYVTFYRIADYEDGHADGGQRAHRTRPFQILAALMGGSRNGKLPF
ncbi:MAG: hypothetical protein ACRD0Z_06630 [Acidimicrobiales bacterium]